MLSTLDAITGYWQIEMVDKDIDTTAFVTRHNIFKCTKKTFVLRSGSVTFHRAINVKLASVIWRHATVYIDDIAINLTTKEII